MQHKSSKSDLYTLEQSAYFPAWVTNIECWAGCGNTCTCDIVRTDCEEVWLSKFRLRLEHLSPIGRHSVSQALD